MPRCLARAPTAIPPDPPSTIATSSPRLQAGAFEGLDRTVTGRLEEILGIAS